MDNQKSSRKIKYATISLARRKMLINEVLEKGKSINSSAKKLGIKCSTAKIIVRRFKETGTIYVRDKTHGIQIYGINDLSLSLQEKDPPVKHQQSQPVQSVQPVFQQPEHVVYAENAAYYVPAQLSCQLEMSSWPLMPMQPVYFFWQ